MTTAYLCSSSLPKSKHLISWVLRVKETTKARKINRHVIELTLTLELLALFYVLLLLYLISICFLFEDSVGGGVRDES